MSKGAPMVSQHLQQPNMEILFKSMEVAVLAKSVYKQNQDKGGSLSAARFAFLLQGTSFRIQELQKQSQSVLLSAFMQASVRRGRSVERENWIPYKKPGSSFQNRSNATKFKHFRKA